MFDDDLCHGVLAPDILAPRDGKQIAQLHDVAPEVVVEDQLRTAMRKGARE